MSEPTLRTSAGRLVKVPAILTLIVLIARLVGELVGGPPILFGVDAGGGFALIGIAWLIPIFGFWFGWRLARENRTVRRPGLSATMHLVGLGLLILGVMGTSQLELGYPKTVLGLAISAVVSCAIGLAAWPAMFKVGLLYGLWARLPVVILTFVLVPIEAGTHFEKLPPGMELESWFDRAVSLSSAQLLFWIPATILAGGLVGSLAAAVHGRKRKGVVELP